MKNRNALLRPTSSNFDRVKVFNQPIVTQVAPLEAFHDAEAYHQDYLAQHPDEPYIIINDMPKVENLRSRYQSCTRRNNFILTELQLGVNEICLAGFSLFQRQVGKCNCLLPGPASTLATIEALSSLAVSDALGKIVRRVFEAASSRSNASS